MFVLAQLRRVRNMQQGKKGEIRMERQQSKDEKASDGV